MGIQNGKTTINIFKTVWWFLINTQLPMNSNCTFRYLHKRNENKCLHKDVNTNIHIDFIHNSQKMQTTQMSTNR